MGATRKHPLCIPVVAAFSRDPEALTWLWDRVRAECGRILLLSEAFDFAESDYYRKSMGSDLKKQFCALEDWYDPAELATDKIRSNAWETEYAQRAESVAKAGSDPVPERPLNVDPGYMSMTKIVLASTKNREHRIYLRDGIYAEVTLAFRDQAWQPMPWTYPDYQREDFRRFFHQVRTEFAKRVAEQQAHEHPSIEKENA